MPAVLIIDGDLTSGNSCPRRLCAGGCVVAPAATARAALGRIRLQPLDVLLADLQLPDMSGIQLLRRVRLEGHMDVAVVIVAGFGALETAVQALKLGAVDHIEKPIIDERLVPVVRSAALRSNTPGHRRPKPRSLPPTDGPCVPPVVSAPDARVARALNAIEQRYGDGRLTVRTVARELGVSTEHLCRLIKRQMGVSFGTILHRTRLLHARQLLLDTRLSVKEIAAAVGYERTSQLDRHFRRQFATTPVALRLGARPAAAPPRSCPPPRPGLTVEPGVASPAPRPHQ